MTKYKLKTNKNMEDGVVDAYKKIEKKVVDTYKKVEDTFVDGYKSVESSFIVKYLEKVDDDGNEQEDSR